MRTNSAGSQNGCLTGRQVAKVNDNQANKQPEREQFPKLFSLLDAVPYLAFSEVGKRNVCKRFYITEQTLEQCLRAYVRPGDEGTEQARRDADLQRVMGATPELLDTIGKAVTPRKRAAKQPTKAKGGAPHARGRRIRATRRRASRPVAARFTIPTPSR